MTWKQAVKSTLRPITQPLLHRLDARTQRDLGRINAELAVVRAELDGLQRALPIVLGQLGDRSGERDLDNSVDELARRVEFVRKEVLFELRYGHRGAVDDEEVESRILDPEKLERMRGAIRLNLGAGHVKKAEYLNVDARALEGIDVMADVGHLPFEKGTVAEIYSAHMLEHFPLEQLRTVLLPYWVSLLAEGGAFVAVVPDMETMINEYVAGRFGFEELREVTYGSQEYEGDFHFNGFSRASIQTLLAEAGLAEIAMRAFARRNGMCYEMEVVGYRRSGTSEA